MFQTKICGVTSAEDAQLVRRLGGDAIGLNFYSDSVRYVGDFNAATIATRWGGDDLLRVGVFVNATADVIRAAIELYALDAIQFHGDEPPEALAELAEYRRIKVFRLHPDRLDQIGDFLTRCDALGCLPEAILVDAWQAAAYGGTGAVAEWDRLTQHRALFGSLPVILAGGLNPSNVAQAIAAVRPDGVDVASGVEAIAGVKDERKTAEFISRAQAAFRVL